MGTNKDEHVAFPGGCEDAEILEQDGEFDKEDDEAVDNSRNIDPLPLRSVRLLQS